MGHGLRVFDEIGDDVLAEVAARSWRRSVAVELLDQELCVENVDAHARQGQVRVAGHGRRVFRLLEERDDAVVILDMHDAEAGRFLARHFHAADRHVGALVNVLGQHFLVVHLVDVVAREQNNVFGAVTLDDIDVLVNSVGRAGIPLILSETLACRQDVEPLVAFRAEEVPTALR